MFNIDEVVLYGSNGVCKIIEITDKKIGKDTYQYYVLKPLCSNTSKLFVPTQNEELVSKMRNVMTKDEINTMLSNSPTEETSWIDNKNERYTACKEIISGGDCGKLIKLIRILHNHQSVQNDKGKRLHLSDERFLKEAEKMVCDELSLVLDIDREQALSMVIA